MADDTNAPETESNATAATMKDVDSTSSDKPVANTSDPNKEVEDNRPHLTEEETLEAQKQGLKDAVAEKTAIANASYDDLPGAEPDRQFHGWDEIQPWANLLDLGIDAFTKKVSLKGDKDGSVPDEKVYGLLALERNGQNRTPYVKAMMKRLGLKSGELPGGGPSYTNDVSNITDL